MATGVSIHAFREGRRRQCPCDNRHRKSFNPRLPRGKATCPQVDVAEKPIVSIHAFREGRRQHRTLLWCDKQRFQSTPSAREGDPLSTPSTSRSGRFNPRLPRGKATQSRLNITARLSFQSTPSAREGDLCERSQWYGFAQFQSTPSAREGDLWRATVASLGAAFQSTPSAREGDTALFHLWTTGLSFNPRLPRGKATRGALCFTRAARVSIHAFREGRRPRASAVVITVTGVSIHAFREGRRLPSEIVADVA